MPHMTPKKPKQDIVKLLMHKLHYGYLYFKRYAIWIFLALFILFVLNIIVKNMGKTNNPAVSQLNSASNINTKIAPIKVEKTQGISSSQLKLLQQQLLTEKQKNKSLEKILSNQELQITSALDSINQSFQTFDSNLKETNKISVLTSASNSPKEYYNKVKAALNKINPMNSKKVDKLSTTIDDKDQIDISEKEG